MAVAFTRGSTTGASDLSITLRNSMGQSTDAYSITYSIFDYSTGIEILVAGYQDRDPVRANVGVYYAVFQVPDNANLGTYRIRWNIVQESNSTMTQAVQEFAVIDANLPANQLVSLTKVVPQTDNTAVMIRRLRYLLRDNNPDKNYHFAPPNSERVIQGFTQVIGFIFQDEELLEYIEMAIDDLNSRPPAEGHTIDSLPTHLRTLITIGAASYAAAALMMNWIAEEFNYSISGVSLDLEKSSKYEAAKNNFEQQYTEKATEYKKTVLHIRGTMYPKFSIGIGTHMLGPYSGSTVQSRRNWVSMGTASEAF